MLYIKLTNELTPHELISILKARTKAFVVEQHAACQEVDADDYQALHVIIGPDIDHLHAYARIINQGTHVTFGRVLVPKAFRGQGLGCKLITVVMDTIQDQYPNLPIKIQAQAYLKKFYQSFGLKPTSKEYLLDQIPHLNMEKHPS